MKKILVLIFMLLIFSCEKEDVSVNYNDENEEKIEIVVEKNNISSLILDDEDNSMFTEEEIKGFKEKNIDISQVKKNILLSNQGDAEAINLLSYIYYITENKVRLKEILELGNKYNVKEAIYNLALVELENRRLNKALIYLNKLPKDYKIDEVKNIKSSIYYQLGVESLSKNNDNFAIKYFKEAYNLGIKELDYEISNIYRKNNDIENLIFWLEKASSRKDRNSMLELANIYLEKGEIRKTIEIYIELYNLGEIYLAENIFELYYKILDNKETIKWYDISKQLGLISEISEIEKLKSLYKQE